MKRKRFALVMLSLVFALTFLTGSSEKKALAARNAVVRVLAISHQSGIVGTGTAFGVGKAGKDTDTFVTNWHVVTDENRVCDEIYLLLDTGAVEIQWDISPDGSLKNARLVRTEDFDKKAIPCEVLYTTDGYPDVAIIRATAPVYGVKALPLMSSEKAWAGCPVHALGYPGVIDNDSTFVQNGVQTQRYLASVEAMSVTKGEISHFSTLAWGEDTDVIWHTAHINHGNSGGPLIADEEGAVIGINTYGYEEDQVMALSISINYAMEALDELGISYDVYSESFLKNNGVLVAGAAAVVLILAAALAAARRKPHKTPQAVAVGGEGSPSPAPVPAPAPVPSPTPAPTPMVTLYGVSGEMRGRSWPLSVQTPVTMGRGDCVVRFDPNAKGVSRLHCRLSVSAGGSVQLTDTHSSFGTFVRGQKIAPGDTVLLHSGDQFYLGDETHSFIVQ